VTTAARWRRDIHRFPEVGFTEFRTASRIAGALADLGWEVVVGERAISTAGRLGVPPSDVLDAAYERALAGGADQRFLPAMRGGNTAVVATLSAGPGPAIGIRTDIDALPINETSSTAHFPVQQGFRSEHDGVMHACGHDGHIGIAMELAERLTARPPERGSVTIFFQPAEEGGRGGRAMAPTGLADAIDLFVAAHLGLALPTGSVASSMDGLLANTKLRAVFHGIAAHSSIAPHIGRNALLGAASAMLAINGIPRVPGHETRVAVGRISGGTASNIVPDTAEMLLETRADDGAINDDLAERARTMLAGAAHMHGLTVDIELLGSVTTARADRAALHAVESAARDLGLSTMDLPPDNGLGSDDATAFMRRVQEHGGIATYIGVGAELVGAHHTPDFDFDEAALPVGVDLLERIVRARPPAASRTMP
jgi:aminobenzoyl-glutamate utilization protein A